MKCPRSWPVHRAAVGGLRGRRTAARPAGDQPAAGECTIEPLATRGPNVPSAGVQHVRSQPGRSRHAVAGQPDASSCDRGVTFRHRITRHRWVTRAVTIPGPSRPGQSRPPRGHRRRSHARDSATRRCGILATCRSELRTTRRGPVTRFSEQPPRQARNCVRRTPG